MTAAEGGSMMGRHTLHLRRLGIDTQQEAVVYMREDCHVCRAEGFRAHTRVGIRGNGRSILAALHLIKGDLLRPGEASLSESAWHALDAHDSDVISLEHPPMIDSLSYVRVWKAAR
jgi:thymidine phosphorylase